MRSRSSPGIGRSSKLRTILRLRMTSWSSIRLSRGRAPAPAGSPRKRLRSECGMVGMHVLPAHECRGDRLEPPVAEVRRELGRSGEILATNVVPSLALHDARRYVSVTAEPVREPRATALIGAPACQ